jgi:hypothetical protein
MWPSKAFSITSIYFYTRHPKPLPKPTRNNPPRQTKSNPRAP